MYSGSWLDFLRWVWVVEISGQTEIAYSLDGFGGYPPICYSGLVPNNGFNYHHPELQGFTLYLERESGTSCDIARAVFNSSLGIWSMPEPLFAGIGNEWNPHGQGQDIVFEADWNGNSDIAFWSPTFETPEFVDTDPAEDRNPVIYLFFWPTAGLHAFWESDRDGSWKIYHSQRQIVGVEPNPDPLLPESFAVSIHPNPGNAEFRIDLELPVSGEVQAAIYDLSGRRVAKIHDGWMGMGSHELEWNAQGFPSGIYLMQAESGKYNQTRKVVLLK